MKQLVDETTSWWNNWLTKWLVDESTGWWNDKAPWIWSHWIKFQNRIKISLKIYKETSIQSNSPLISTCHPYNWRCDTQHNDTSYNNTQHDNRNTDLSMNDNQHRGTRIAALGAVFLCWVTHFYCYAECRYYECRFAKCFDVECRHAECSRSLTILPNPSKKE
jgi:hypothetical protein